MDVKEKRTAGYDPSISIRAGIEKKTRKSPVPANIDRITEGAMNLSLSQMIDLNRRLDAEIMAKLQSLEDQLNTAKSSLAK